MGIIGFWNYIKQNGLVNYVENFAVDHPQPSKVTFYVDASNLFGKAYENCAISNFDKFFGAPLTILESDVIENFHKKLSKFGKVVYILDGSHSYGFKYHELLQLELYFVFLFRGSVTRPTPRTLDALHISPSDVNYDVDKSKVLSVNHRALMFQAIPYILNKHGCHYQISRSDADSLLHTIALRSEKNCFILSNDGDFLTTCDGNTKLLKLETLEFVGEKMRCALYDGVTALSASLKFTLEKKSQLPKEYFRLLEEILRVEVDALGKEGKYSVADFHLNRAEEVFLYLINKVYEIHECISPVEKQEKIDAIMLRRRTEGAASDDEAIGRICDYFNSFHLSRLFYDCLFDVTGTVYRRWPLYAWSAIEGKAVLKKKLVEFALERKKEAITELGLGETVFLEFHEKSTALRKDQEEEEAGEELMEENPSSSNRQGKDGKGENSNAEDDVVIDFEKVANDAFVLQVEEEVEDALLKDTPALTAQQVKDQMKEVTESNEEEKEYENFFDSREFPDTVLDFQLFALDFLAIDKSIVPAFFTTVKLCLSFKATNSMQGYFGSGGICRNQVEARMMRHLLSFNTVCSVLSCLYELKTKKCLELVCELTMEGALFLHMFRLTQQKFNANSNSSKEGGGEEDAIFVEGKMKAFYEKLLVLKKEDVDEAEEEEDDWEKEVIVTAPSVCFDSRAIRKNFCEFEAGLFTCVGARLRFGKTQYFCTALDNSDAICFSGGELRGGRELNLGDVVECLFSKHTRRFICPRIKQRRRYQAEVLWYDKELKRGKVSIAKIPHIRKSIRSSSVHAVVFFSSDPRLSSGAILQFSLRFVFRVPDGTDKKKESADALVFVYANGLRAVDLGV